MKKTIAEQISAFENTRAAKQARMDALMDDAAEKGETLAPDAKEEYATLKQEVREIDEHLVLLRDREQSNRNALVPVTPLPTAAAQTEQRAPWNQADAPPEKPRVQVIRAGRPQLAKATHFFRWAQVMMMAKGNKFEAANYCLQNDQWMAETPELVDILRTAVPAGTTSNSTWAAPLVNYTVMVSEFIELLYAQTVLGRLRGFRNVPFNIKVPRQTAGTSVNWVGEGAAKPLSKGAFDTVSLTWSKVAGICAFTQELVRFSNPSAEALIRDDLTKAVAKFLDEQFLDTSKVAVANVSPASVTNGADAITATGETATAFRKDFKHAMANFVLENMDVAGVTILMKPLQAMSLGLIVNSTTSVPEFPNIGVGGGSILGVPVLVSNNVPSGKIIFIAPGEILLADDGGVSVDISTEASLQMDDNPTDDATSLVSLWQSNMIGLRVERFINWVKRRQEAVVYITGADYGGVGTGT